MSPYLPDGVHVKKIGSILVVPELSWRHVACLFPVVFHTFAVTVYSPFLCLLIYSFYFLGASLHGRLSHTVHFLSTISVFPFMHVNLRTCFPGWPYLIEIFSRYTILLHCFVFVPCLKSVVDPIFCSGALFQ